MLKYLNYKYSGITLIELLVVVTIISILAGITISVINPQALRNQAHDSNRREELAVIQGALERWYSDNNQYPSALDMDCDPLVNGAVTYLDEVGDGNFPCTSDTSDNMFFYSAGPNQQGYCLCANLVNEPADDASCGDSDWTGNTELHDTTADADPDVDHCVKNPF